MVADAADSRREIIPAISLSPVLLCTGLSLRPRISMPHEADGAVAGAVAVAAKVEGEARNAEEVEGVLLAHSSRQQRLELRFRDVGYNLRAHYDVGSYRDLLICLFLYSPIR